MGTLQPEVGSEQKNSDFSFYYRTSELDLVADWTDLSCAG